MTDAQIYGVWEDMSAVRPLSYQQMELDAQHLAQHWRRCSLSSDFWARYTALFVPTRAPLGRLRRDALEGVLSFLLNELFENCAKFSGGSLSKVGYAAWVQQDVMIFQITNHIEPTRQESFVQFIQQLLTSDLDELYFRRLEESAETNAKGSGLGYLSLIKDYGIRFGFRFSSVAEESVAVAVQAHLSMEEI